MQAPGIQRQAVAVHRDVEGRDGGRGTDVFQAGARVLDHFDAGHLLLIVVVGGTHVDVAPAGEQVHAAESRVPGDDQRIGGCRQTAAVEHDLVDGV